MSSALKTQMAEYGKQMLDAAPPITEEELETVLDHEIDSHVVRPRTRSLGPWVAVSVAAVTLVLFGLVALLMSGEEPVAGTDSYTWSRIPYDEAVFGEEFEQGMSGVTVGGPGFVAVGGVTLGVYGQEGSAVVWTSPDGITWSRIPNNDAVFGGGVMHSVTAGGPGLVAVGTSDQAAVWTSPDGITWSRVPDNEAVFGGGEAAFGTHGVDYTAMESVTAGGPGLVAVGIKGHPHGVNVKAVVWTSPDGTNWSRVPHNDAVFGRREDGHHTEMSSVTSGGPGLVAVGGAWSREDNQGGAAVWTSVDGIEWSRVPDSDAVFSDGGMHSVTAGGPGLVAVGGFGSDAAVWTSPDGFVWSRVAHDEAVFGEATMSSVTVGGSGLVAVGWDDVGAAAWTSPDGINWSRVPHEEAVFVTQKPDLSVLEMRSITAIGSRLVAVGANGVRPTAGATKSDAAVWVATPAD